MKSPDLVFISESQTFQSDIKAILLPICHKYEYFLNSDDLHYFENTFNQSVSYGGTLVLWRKKLSSFVSLFPVKTPAFLPLILKLPRAVISAHIALYLPTGGRDSEFFDEVANLRFCLTEIQEKHPECIFFLRGDSNVNSNNQRRVSVLKQLLDDFNLNMVEINHKTYHHFVGNGEFDSNLDVLLHSKKHDVEEVLLEIICKHSNPLVLSHHDIILSRASIPAKACNDLVCAPPLKAPRINNTRHKIVWSEHGVETYRTLLEPQLLLIREVFIDSASVESMAVALQLTNFVLTNTAKLCNQVLPLNGKKKDKQMFTPLPILKAKKDLQRAHKKLGRSRSEQNVVNYKKFQVLYRKAVKMWRFSEGMRRDQRLHTIMTDKPTDIFKFMRSNKPSSREILELKVGNRVYSGDDIPDGFYESMTNIKSCDLGLLKSDENLADHFSTHQHILKLCEQEPNLPLISVTVSQDLLTRMKKDVTD